MGRQAAGFLVFMMVGLAAVGTRAGWAEVQTITYRPSVLVQIGVSDLDRAVRFYTTTLGFTMTERRDDLRFAHIATNVPGLEIGLNQVEKPQGSGSVVLNIGVTHVGEARGVLESRGVAFRGDTVVIPGKVALAAFADPDGNVLRFAGPSETAKPK